MQKLKQHLLVVQIVIGLACLVIIGAVSNTSAKAAVDIAQGYSTSSPDVGVGMAVSVDDTNNQKVVLSNRGNMDKFVGVVTTIDNTLLAVSGKDIPVLVANSGQTTVFWSDINGSIKKGDLLTVSPLSGILMKASDSDSFIAGTALDNSTNRVDTKNIQTDLGTTKTVVIDSQKVNLQPHYRQVSNTATGGDSFLVLFGKSVTGRKVNQGQVIGALITFFLILAVEGSIIYGAVMSTIAAIGRNPLSKRSVYRQLLQVSWMSLLILSFGFGVIFLILWI